jgi:uncharacterized protein (DUF433 family)
LRLEADPLPLRRDEYGAIRVGNTRVLLDLVIDAFNDSASPKTIVQWYDSLPLADVHAVIGYYLNHKQEVDAYLKEREALAEEIQRKISATQPARPHFRDELLARRNQLLRTCR